MRVNRVRMQQIIPSFGRLFEVNRVQTKPKILTPSCGVWGNTPWHPLPRGLVERSFAIFIIIIHPCEFICMRMRSKPVKFSCCSTNFEVLNGPVAGQRAALTAHAGSRHHQVHHIAPLYDHTGDARACTPSSGGQIESGFHARSVRTVSEPSRTSLPTLLTRPMLHHRRQSHRPTLCRPRWRHPHSHLRLASPTRAQRLILIICTAKAHDSAV